MDLARKSEIKRVPTSRVFRFGFEGFVKIRNGGPLSKNMRKQAYNGLTLMT